MGKQAYDCGLDYALAVVGGKRGGVEVDRLVLGRHDAVGHQVLDDLRGRYLKALRQLGHSEGGRQGELLDRGYGGVSWLSRLS